MAQEECFSSVSTGEMRNGQREHVGISEGRARVSCARIPVWRISFHLLQEPIDLTSRNPHEMVGSRLGELLRSCVSSQRRSKIQQDDRSCLLQGLDLGLGTSRLVNVALPSGCTGRSSSVWRSSSRSSLRTSENSPPSECRLVLSQGPFFRGGCDCCRTLSMRRTTSITGCPKHGHFPDPISLPALLIGV